MKKRIILIQKLVDQTFVVLNFVNTLWVGEHCDTKEETRVGYEKNTTG